MKSHRLLFITLLLTLVISADAQELLTREEAVERALEFNYDIKVAYNNKEIAANNATTQVNGYMPTVSLSGGSSYSSTRVNRGDDEGFVISANGGVLRYNSGATVNYTIFDGLGRKYTYEQSKNQAFQSELQARQIIENALVQLYQSYFEVARLTENVIGQKQTLEISKDRLLRTEYSYEFGQASQLDLLNAQVDINTDSINYMTAVQQLENSKRNLNLLLGRDVNTAFEVDTMVNYIEGIDMAQMIEMAPSRNVRIQLLEKQIEASNHSIMINRSSIMPRLNASASYQWSKTDYEEGAFFSDVSTFGPTAGLNLSWTLFDGGATSTRVQNARIAMDNQQILKEQATQQLLRDINNAFSNYRTALFVLTAQRTNLRTNQLNFDRSLEQYELGQVTSLEFRQAQLNLLNARLNYNQAKYNAKNAELAFLQLSGEMLNVTL